MAQEPPAERRHRRRSARTSTATTGTASAAAGARRATPPRSCTAARRAFSAPETRALRDFVNSRVDRRRPADPDAHHAPHQRQARPVAVRLHEDRRPAGHDRRSTTAPSSSLGRAMAALQRLQGRAVVGPVHHRRRPDRLDVRDVTGSSRYTFELYPAETRTVLADHYPRRLADRAPRPSATGARSCCLIDRAACPYATLGAAASEGGLRAAVRRPGDQPGLDA